MTQLSRGLAALAAGLLLSAGAAQAGDVQWSIGIHAPLGGGASVGTVFSNTRPVVVAPPPVVYAPAPVVVQPAPVYVPAVPVYRAPPVVYRPTPVIYAPPPVFVEHRHRHGGWGRWERGHWERERWEGRGHRD